MWVVAPKWANGFDSPHEKMRFECNECHTAASWKEIAFDHQKTRFSLDGRHMALRCVQCHDIKNFGSASSDCVSCHTDIHQAKLSNSCDRCHTTRSWVVNAIQAHANTSFPLIGVHARLDCKSCHISEIEGEYSFVKSECVACHSADFQRAQSPSHTAMSFGTRCEDCHNPLGWQPASFNRHDAFFPIMTGVHAGRWNSCADCHANGQDFSIFSCFGCHEHSQARMDGGHGDVRGYSYDSNACFSCHRTGQRGG
jgi:hypothetical protein